MQKGSREEDRNKEPTETGSGRQGEGGGLEQAGYRYWEPKGVELEWSRRRKQICLGEVGRLVWLGKDTGTRSQRGSRRRLRLDKKTVEGGCEPIVREETGVGENYWWLGEETYRTRSQEGERLAGQ